MSDDVKPRDYLINTSGIAIPFYPENGEKNPDPKNQTHVREVMPDDEFAVYLSDLIKTRSELFDEVKVLKEQLDRTQRSLAKAKEALEFYMRDPVIVDFGNRKAYEIKQICPGVVMDPNIPGEIENPNPLGTLARKTLKEIKAIEKGEK